MIEPATCQWCKTPQPLDGSGRIDRHQRQYQYLAGDEIHTYVTHCHGSSRPSAEQAAVTRERRLKPRRAQVAAARADAAVAHDMLAERRQVNPKWLAKLLELALVDYCLRFPEYSFRYRCAWLFYDGNPHTKRLSKRGRIDVYCTFCRELLYQRANWRGDYSVHTEDHTRICALRCLAGIAEPVGPGNYRLPADVRPDVEASA